jgi:hypothetical protein
VEYKYCPNLTIIDTPGLIAPAPGRKNRVLQAQARAVESLVRAKMQHKEFIILCLEDCSDWINATTRRVVMQIDPELSRTVIVSTKLDTRIPQFARPSDVEVFLSPPASALDGCILGDSPFFTSVPSGRVGSGTHCLYSSNDDFKQVHYLIKPFRFIFKSSVLRYFTSNLSFLFAGSKLQRDRRCCILGGEIGKIIVKARKK